MDTYYSVLGLEPGASQAEIKKAYFKLVRQHSPESDPEQFQKIREAYEELKREGSAQEGPAFVPPSEPFAVRMLEQIEKYRKAGNSEMFRDTCEEAWRLFPQDIRFLYLLVIAQRQCGNTGKAVKNGELLVKKEPENKWFHKELALSYMERGFTQKAYSACGRAYELGCRDNDFLLTYALECDEYGEHSKGMELLLEIVRRERKWTKENVPELLEAYFGLLKMNYEGEGTFFPEIIEGLCRALEQYKLYLAEYMPELAIMLSHTSVCGGGGMEEYQKIKSAFGLMQKTCRSEEEREIIRISEAEFDYQRLINDTRICETLEIAYEVYYEMAELEPYARKFALTDVQLCMLEEREEILKQAEILKQDYPDYYGKLEDFLKRLQPGQNLLFLKDSLLKTYRRMSPDFNAGYFFEKYPHEKEKAQGILISDGASMEPYVRSGKKIGRNAPCPCGSGKKYKNCCMKK